MRRGRAKKGGSRWAPRRRKLAEVARSSLSEKANKRKRERERRAAASQRKYEMMPVSRVFPAVVLPDGERKGGLKL